MIGEDNFTKQPTLMNFDQVIQINFTTPTKGNIWNKIISLIFF